MILGLIQNDASLLPCRLHQLRGLVRLSPDEAPDAVGAGYIQNGGALLRRRPGTIAAVVQDPMSLLDDVKAPGAIVHVRRATVGTFKDENTHPFRYRNWIFAHSGTVARFGDLRPALCERLPPFLRRSIAGETDSEHVFALLLAALKDHGVLEVLNPEPERLSAAIRWTLDQVEELAGQVGGAGESTLDFVATNGRVLGASRVGPRELFYAQLDGLEACEVCGLPADAPETHPLKVPHQNLRSVVVASRLTEQGRAVFRPLSDGQVLVAGQDFVAHVYSA